MDREMLREKNESIFEKKEVNAMLSLEDLIAKKLIIKLSLLNTDQIRYNKTDLNTVLMTV